MGIFNPENGIYRATEKLADLFLLSVFWLVCSLPLVTVGPATAALYNTTVRAIRGNHRNSWALFIQTFKRELKVGVLASLAVVPVMAALVVLLGLLYQMALVDQTGYILYYAYQVFLLLPVGTACYIFPVLSRFTFRPGGLLLNSSKLAVAHLPSTVLLGLLMYAAVLLGAAFFPLIFLLPTVVALLQSLLLERIFRPYIDVQRRAAWMQDEEDES